MPASTVEVPTTVDELIHGIGYAILRSGFRSLGMDTPEVALRSAAGDRNTEAAVAWLDHHQEAVEELKWVAGRSVEYHDSGDTAMAYLADFHKVVDVLKPLLTELDNYLNNLIIATMDDNDQFAALLRLFLELPKP